MLYSMVEANALRARHECWKGQGKDWDIWWSLKEEYQIIKKVLQVLQTKTQVHCLSFPKRKDHVANV